MFNETELEAEERLMNLTGNVVTTTSDGSLCIKVDRNSLGRHTALDPVDLLLKREHLNQKIKEKNFGVAGVPTISHPSTALMARAKKGRLLVVWQYPNPEAKDGVSERNLYCALYHVKTFPTEMSSKDHTLPIDYRFPVGSKKKSVEPVLAKVPLAEARKKLQQDIAAHYVAGNLDKVRETQEVLRQLGF
jgi:hypothetical protein